MFKNQEIDYKGMALLFDHQNAILSYLHPENPYRSLIVLYKLGSGKTYAACCLAQLYLIEGFKVLYLSNSVNAVENFNKEYNKMILDLRLKNYNKRIDTMTFTKYYKRKDEKEYGIIILDEVHNLREIGVRYTVIKNKLDEAIHSKILLMTATPIVDNIKELSSIKKLSGEEKPKILKSINTNNQDLKIEYVGTKIFGETLYLSKMKGLQLEEYKKCDNKDVFTRARQSTLSYSNKFDVLLPLEEQSCKMFSLIKVLKQEPTVIFCFYIDRGINIVTKILEAYGYKKLGNKTKDKTYAVISGDTSTSESNNILNKFNAINNMDGSNINILIGSSVMKESVTLNRVRSLHILTPFWNYSQIKQSIGRTIRYNSHQGLENPVLKIYLHASYINDPTKEDDSVDIKMWSISSDKKSLIKAELNDKVQYAEIENTTVFSYPEPDNRLVFRHEDEIWDFTECFEHNKFKISWCNIYEENAIKYDLKEKTVHKSNINSKFIINRPLDEGYTIWRSAVDNRLRITYMEGKKCKYSKRGKLLSNVKIKDIEKELNTDNLKDYLLSKNRYFDKQIEYVL